MKISLGRHDMRVLGFFAGAAILALAACSTGQKEPLRIADVSVTADLPALGSRQAVAYWKNVGTDLETAIADQFVGYLDPAGKRIDVNVDELSLASPFATGATAETARLSGLVTLLNADGTKSAAYNVTASAQDVQNALPEGSKSVAPTSGAYYQAIIEAFARGAANTLKESHEGSS
ncbi:hypothetical protein HNP73_001924 [Amaricoccus macauensis]|uniref:DUF4410 domain-containing protein n=1 Tax=Amaricoccus macauensis TaxID=57001 RepID=A0A840SNQ7_9RHOB|nr:hypothetical protein [Amaricoccus macauensis]MBB5221988.1 hypothetical protein [Amaricoccus macauensis]